MTILPNVNFNTLRDALNFRPLRSSHDPGEQIPEYIEVPEEPPRPADEETLARFQQTRTLFTSEKMVQHEELLRKRIIPLLDLRSRRNMQYACRLFHALLTRPDEWEALAKRYRLPYVPPPLPPSENSDSIEPYHFEAEQLVVRSYISQRRLQDKNLEFIKTEIPTGMPKNTFSEMLFLPGGKFLIASGLNEQKEWSLYLFSPDYAKAGNYIAQEQRIWSRPGCLSARYVRHDSDTGIMITYYIRFKADTGEIMNDLPTPHDWKTEIKEEPKFRYVWKVLYTRLGPHLGCDHYDPSKPGNDEYYYISPDRRPAFQAPLQPDIFEQLECPTVFRMDGNNWAMVVTKPTAILWADLTPPVTQHVDDREGERIRGMRLRCTPNSRIPGSRAHALLSPRTLESVHIYAIRVLPEQHQILVISAGESAHPFTGEITELFFAEIYDIPEFEDGRARTITPVERHNFIARGIVGVKISDPPVDWWSTEKDRLRNGPPPPISIIFTTNCLPPAIEQWSIWPSDNQDFTGYEYRLRNIALQGLHCVRDEVNLTVGTNCALGWSTKSHDNGSQSLYTARHVYPRWPPRKYPEHLRQALKANEPVTNNMDLLSKHKRSQTQMFEKCSKITALAFDEYSGRICFGMDKSEKITFLNLVGPLDLKLVEAQKMYIESIEIQQNGRKRLYEEAERMREPEYAADEEKVEDYLLDLDQFDDQLVGPTLEELEKLDQIREEEWLTEVERIRLAFFPPPPTGEEEEMRDGGEDDLEGTRPIFRRDEDMIDGSDCGGDDPHQTDWGVDGVWYERPEYANPTESSVEDEDIVDEDEEMLVDDASSGVVHRYSVSPSPEFDDHDFDNPLSPRPSSPPAVVDLASIQVQTMDL